MKCKVVVREWLNDVEFYFYEEHEHEIYVAKPVEFIFEKHPMGASVDPKKATFTLRYEKAIGLVESLLSEARFSMLGSNQRMRKDDLLEGGELKATKEHLKDMQKLVFEVLPKPPVIIQGNAGEPYSWQREMLLTPRSESDEVKVKKSRIRLAAKSCGTAHQILEQIFPELFGPGWKNETD